MDERSMVTGVGFGHHTRRIAVAALSLVGAAALAAPAGAAQFASVAEPNLTAIGSGQASAPAETARIQFLVGIEDPFDAPLDVPTAPDLQVVGKRKGHRARRLGTGPRRASTPAGQPGRRRSAKRIWSRCSR